MKIIALTGAGMSAESGIPTFRGSGGLWEGFKIEDVASLEGWNKNPELVLEFYNERRKNIQSSLPNKGHEILAELEKQFELTIITQNIDDLHERAGSKNVLHLHGEILKSRSLKDAHCIYPCTHNIHLGDLCEFGFQLRPHIVWFGEMVPMMEDAIHKIKDADIVVVIGTSMVVYPAASLLYNAPLLSEKYIINPETPVIKNIPQLHFIKEVASIGLLEFKNIILKKINQ